MTTALRIVTAMMQLLGVQVSTMPMCVSHGLDASVLFRADFSMCFGL